MSQAGGPSSGGGFGEARIDFTGNTAPLEAAAAKAVGVTTEAAGRAQKAVETQTEATDKATESGLKHGRQMLSLVGTAGALLAAFDKLAAGIHAAQQASALLAEEFEKINSASGGAFGDKAGGIAGSLDATNKALDAQRAAIDKTMRDWGSLSAITEKVVDNLFFGGASKQAQQAQLDQIEKTREAFTKLAEERLKAEGEESAKKVEEADKVKLEALKERVRKETAATLEGIDRIKFEEESRIAEINKLREKASDQEKRQLDEIKRLIGVQTQREIDEFKRKEAEKRQEAAATALAIERAFSRALGQVQQQSAALFTGDQVTAQLERVASLLEQIADQRSMIGGRD